MSEFDDIFKEKMNGEQQFSGQKRSWDAVNKDLQAFSVGQAALAKTLAVWKAAGLALAVLSAGLLWERREMVQEHQDLIRQLDQVKTEQRFSSGGSNIQPALPAPPSAPLVKSQDAPKPSVEGPTTSENKMSRSRSSDQGYQKVASQTNTKLQAVPSSGSKNDAEAIAEAVKRENKTTESLASEIKSPGVSAQVTPGAQPIEKGIDTTRIAASKTDSMASPPSPTLSTEPLKQTPKPDSSAARIDSVQAHASVPAPQLTPKPIQEKKWRFGVRWATGFAHFPADGAGRMTGQGAWLEYRLWNKLALTAGADWTQFGVSANRNPDVWKEVQIPPHGPGHHDYELRQVEANLQTRQYTLGAGYCQKMFGRWWATTGIAHSWVKIPSKTVIYTYEEVPHGPFPPPHLEKEYLIADSGDRTVSNYWKFSAGINYETRSLSLGVKVDYATLLSQDDPFLDATFAGVTAAYKF